MSTAEQPPRKGPPSTSLPAGIASGAGGNPPAENAPTPGRRRGRNRKATTGPGGNMLPGRERRRSRLERLVVRLIATGGVVGIGVALGAILTSDKVEGWIIGLVIALVSIVLSALLWSSKQL